MTPVSRSGFLFRSLFAWGLILGIVGFLVVGSLPRKEDSSCEKNYLVMDLQMRVMVGASQLVRNGQTIRPEEPKWKELHAYYENAAAYNKGPIGQRIRFIPIAGEILNAETALEHLNALKDLLTTHQKPLSLEEERILNALSLIYRQISEPDSPENLVPQEEKLFLIQQIGWYGELANSALPKTPASEREAVLRPAKTSFLTLVISILVFGLLVLSGLIGMIVLGIFWIQNRLHTGMELGRPSIVYLETFALWLGLYLGLLFLNAQIDLPIPAPTKAILAMALSLSVLIYPRLQGITWKEIRNDIGWTNGRAGIWEFPLGLGCYAFSLPLLIVGSAFMVGLMLMQNYTSGDLLPPFETQPEPVHPIFSYLANGNFWEIFQWVFVASVMAPLMEETMFRGVLYRYLRESSRWFRPFLSVMFSGIVNSLIFASIHPQGLITVPVLMALALGFTLFREWRGTIIPSMVAHGTSNGLMIGIVLLATMN